MATPLRGLENGAEHAQARRFAGAVGAQESEDFAGLHVEADTSSNAATLPAAQVAKSFGNVLDVNHQGSARVTRLAARLIEVYRVPRGAQQRTSPRRLGNPSDTPLVKADVNYARGCRCRKNNGGHRFCLRGWPLRDAR